MGGVSVLFGVCLYLVPPASTQTLVKFVGIGMSPELPPARLREADKVDGAAMASKAWHSFPSRHVSQLAVAMRSQYFMRCRMASM